MLLHKLRFLLLIGNNLRDNINKDNLSNRIVIHIIDKIIKDHHIIMLLNKIHHLLPNSLKINYLLLNHRKLLKLSHELSIQIDLINKGLKINLIKNSNLVTIILKLYLWKNKQILTCYQILLIILMSTKMINKSTKIIKIYLILLISY